MKDVIINSGLFLPREMKEEFAKYLLDRTKWYNIIGKGKLYYSGIGTYHHLHKFEEHLNEGNISEAYKSAEEAFKWYDGILRGVPVSELEAFSREYAQDFKKEAKEVLKEIKAQGHDVHIVSAGIKEIIEIVLEEKGIISKDRPGENLIKSITSNYLDVDDGIIQGLIKEVDTPDRKIEAFEKTHSKIKVGSDVIAAGYGDWDVGIVNEAYRIVLIITAEHIPSEAVKKVYVKRSQDDPKSVKEIINLNELPKALEMLENR
ncbi:Uncharacterised protein [uncultured archaeon]|nr:Uncharacterised protein [uncultured archaeon]